MISKWKINLIAFLISLTLFSVGFSSWQITNSITETTQSGMVQIDSIEKIPVASGQMAKLIELDLFLYDDLGFVNSTNGAYTDKGVISAKFELNLGEGEENLRAFFSNMNSLYLEAKLTAYTKSNSAFLLFNTITNDMRDCDAYYIGVNSYDSANKLQLKTDSNDNIIVDISKEEALGATYEIGIRLSNILSDITLNSISTPSKVYFQVDFIFNAPQETFATFYSAINNGDCKFGVTAKVSGYVAETGN